MEVVLEGAEGRKLAGRRWAAGAAAAAAGAARGADATTTATVTPTTQSEPGKGEADKGEADKRRDAREPAKTPTEASKAAGDGTTKRRSGRAATAAASTAARPSVALAPGRRILALHGWLDNANSFEALAPLLVEALAAVDPDGATVVAIDFPGHGRSDSRPGPLYFFDHVEAVLEALEALAWPACDIIGHSLGGNTAVMFAAACPDRVTSLTVRGGSWSAGVRRQALAHLSSPAYRASMAGGATSRGRGLARQLIESWGPVTTAPDATVRSMAEALAERRRRLARPTSAPTFASTDEAIDRYHRGMATPVARSSSAAIVPRSLRPAGPDRWTWSWDDKWLLRSFLPPSEPQVLAMLAALVCPVLMLSGAAGYEAARYSGDRKRAELAARKQAVRRLTEVVLPALGHYPHLDAPATVAALIVCLYSPSTPPSRL